MGKKRRRSIQIPLRVTPEELELMDRKMASLGTTNRTAYICKMAIDGYVVNLDLPELRELVSLMRRSSNNLNQLAKRVNATNRLYAADMEDLQKKQEELWQSVKVIINKLSALG